MVSKKIIIAIVLVLALALQIGCSAQSNQEDTQKPIMDEFDALLKTDIGLAEVIEYIDHNIALLSKENASIMIAALEETQKNNLPELDEKFYSDDSVQNKMNQIYKPGFDINDIDNVDGGELKDLLVETRDTGYKVETAEGMYFPIINYEFYNKYSSYVTADVKEYIDIMAVESGKVPAKDAALVIGWDEVLERALSQEKFIEQHPDSIKINDIKELYKKYVTFTLFGLNNTPLFSYDSKTMRDDAKSVYMKAVESNESSGYMETLREFLDVLEKDNYRLTDEVDKYRKSVSENM